MLIICRRISLQLGGAKALDKKHLSSLCGRGVAAQDTVAVFRGEFASTATYEADRRPPQLGRAGLSNMGRDGGGSISLPR